jgi:exodeoxyribonuclease-3
MKLISWNVNGIRAGVKKGFIDVFKELDADIFCIQETKAQSDQTEDALSEIEGYEIHSTHAERKGYSGVTVLTRVKPLGVTEGIDIDEHDQEGRVLTLEYDDFYLVNVYVPNSGSGLKRLDYRKSWDEAFLEYNKKLEEKKPVIMTGDFNVAHNEIDLARPKSNYNKTAGYTQTEIDGMDNIRSAGFIDSFRHFYPDKVEYTFWSMKMRAREKNLGWRIDYFLVSPQLKAKMKDARILTEIMGSDHCPIVLELKD